VTWKIAAAIFVFAALIYVFIPRRPVVITEPRVSGQLQTAISQLLSTDASDAFLIVWIGDTEDFVQFAAVPGTVQLDFPLVTARQKQLRTAVVEACRAVGLTETINQGTDGSEFLDYDISGSSQSIAETIREVLNRVFGVSADEDLLFEANGFALAALPGVKTDT